MIEIELELEEIKPYRKNPRDNTEAVKYCEESIRRYGYRNYIIVDSGYEIITGHTRYAALKRLGYERVKVQIADDMTAEQIKAYRLADNKVSEYAKWNPSLLELELSELKELDISMVELGFEPVELDMGGNAEEENEQSYYGDERERTFQHDNFDIYQDIPDDERTEQGYPILRRNMTKPKSLIPFSDILYRDGYSSHIHFFIDDYRFERVWQQPERYLKRMKEYSGAIMPDFSMYTDMPIVMQQWNKWRNQVLAWYWQRNGIDVIPNVMFSDEKSYEWCFEGLPRHSTVMLSSVGTTKDKTFREIFRNGTEEMIRRLEPKRILLYGKKPEWMEGSGIETAEYESRVFNG